MNLGDTIEINGTKLEIVGYINDGGTIRGGRAYRVMINGVLNYLPDQVLQLLAKKSDTENEWKSLYFETKKQNETKDKIIFELTNKLTAVEP